jgi:hypothetical protein
LTEVGSGTLLVKALQEEKEELRSVLTERRMFITHAILGKTA